MIRLLCVIVGLVLCGGLRPSGAQPPPSLTSSSSPLEEATRLDALVAKFRDQGRLQDAVGPAERGLALREKTLGVNHPDVATSLNDLGALYEELGVYKKAEPLYLRALAIREKVLGPMHSDVATSLGNLAVLYCAQGAYDKAEPLYLREIEIREKAQGSTHLDLATSQTNLGALYHMQGSYGKAEQLYLRALEVREKELGPVHADVAASLHNLAMLYRERGLDRKAEPLLARALAIREKMLGPTHPDVASSLTSLAGLHFSQGAYGKAESLFLRALDIREKALGPMHPDVAMTLEGLAQLYHKQAAYANAELLLVRALDIEEKALGPMHPSVATTLDDLALLYLDRGVFAKAEPLLRRALAIREKALGPSHPDVATSLNDLAALYSKQAAYAKAEPLYLRALAIRESALGATHPGVAVSMSNLAMLYLDQGAFEKAEPPLLRALGIDEAALGPMHPDVATDLNNLAIAYWRQGAFEKAEQLYLRGLDIRQKALGPTHPDVADSLDTLAVLYEDQGMNEKAEPLYVRSLDIYEKALGPMHPAVALGLNNLAQFYAHLGVDNKAEPLLVRAIDIAEKALGPMHPSVAPKLNNLAMLYERAGAYEKAESLFSRSTEIREQDLRASLARLPEPRKRALIALVRGETERMVSLHVHARSRSDVALKLAVTTVLRRKGRVLDSLIDAETTLRGHLTPLLRTQFDQLRAAHAQLAARLYAGTTSRDGRDRVDIAAIRAQIDELESRLSAASADFDVQSAPVALSKIQSALPRNAALVEFVRYRRFAPRETPSWKEDRYVAYLLTWRGPPRWVALGEAKPIEANIDAAVAAMDGKSDAEHARAALRHLDALVFAPLHAQLIGVSHVILAPDGKLNLVPFEALIDQDGRYRLEQYLMSYVTTGRDVLRFGVRRKPRSQGLIIANPDYGPPSMSKVADTVAFTPLPGTLVEATDLQPYFSTRPLTGAQATKSALEALRAPAILHIATHGFYSRESLPPSTRPRSLASPNVPLQPSPLANSVLVRGTGLRGMDIEASESDVPAPRSDDLADSLDRAGLAMANANQSAQGIVTAREIAGFDWWGTQLVVLSACETGVGALSAHDGVYGLRRALLLAGAESQVVSLWRVSDSSTRELMRDFYRELARGAGVAEALRRAKLNLFRRPRDSHHVHPYYWASFIPVGNWTAIDKNILSSQQQGR